MRNDRNKRAIIKDANRKEAAAGLVLAIAGFILFFSFMAVDSVMFDYTAPTWIWTLSDAFYINGATLDILMTLTVAGIVMMFHEERRKGRA